MDYEVFLELVDPEKITKMSRVDCIWDVAGIWVDLNYSFDESGWYKEYQTCFAELYEDGEPSEAIWDLAMKIATYIKEKYGIPLDVIKTEGGHYGKENCSVLSDRSSRNDC